VHKFGGTCVAAAERIEAICKYLIEGGGGAAGSQSPAQRVVVVSAMGAHPSSPTKVTDLLINMVTKAAAQNQEFLLDLAALQVGAG
jgi:aspartokinase/homoserine dehydrogenase 1